MPSTACLTADELRAYHLGTLSLAEQERIARHLEACPGCESLAEQEEEATDFVVAALRQYPPSALTPLPVLQASSWKRAGDSLARTAPEVPERNLPLKVPQRIGDYQVLEELGRGGMGVVYKAHQRHLNRVVALKMVLGGTYATSLELTRFLVEAEMVARLTHPAIVQIYEVGEQDGMPFLALEYVGGGTLADRLRGKPWSVREAAALVEQLAQAIHHAHQRGVVHRDLKPANILLDGQTGLPKITDFGLARAIQSPTGLTRTGTLLGTPAYMAPEQAGGAPQLVGPSSDIYALGIILYELLIGRPPFQNENPIALLRQIHTQEVPTLSRSRPGLPHDLSTICLHCLEKEPNRRYPTAEALADDLRCFLQGDPIRARPVGRIERSWKWARRRPTIALLLSLLAITLPTGTGLSLYFAFGAQNRAVEAENSRDEAQRERAKSQEARRTSDLAAAELTFQAAMTDAEAGLVDRALFRLVEALRLAPRDAAAFRRVVRINLAMLAERQPVLQQVLPDRTNGWFRGAEGMRLVTENTKHLVEFWETASGQAQHNGEMAPVAVSEDALLVTQDGRIVLTRTSNGQQYCLRDSTTGAMLGDPTLPGSYTFSTDSQWLCMSRVIDRFKSWRRAGQIISTRTGHAVGPVIEGSVYLLPGRAGRTVLVTLPNRDPDVPDAPAIAHFYDIESRQSLDRPDFAPGGGNGFAAFDGRAVVTVDAEEGMVRWWDPGTGQALRAPWQPSQVYGPRARFVRLSADGQTIVALGSDNRLRWYCAANGQMYATSLFTGSGSSRRILTLAPDGNSVLVVSQGNELRVWNVPPLPPLPVNSVARLSEIHFQSATYSPDRQRVYLGWDNTARPIAHLLETTTGWPIGPSYGDINALPAYSGDGKRLATCVPAVLGRMEEILLRETATGKQLTRITVPTFVRGLALDREGEHLAVGVFGGTLLIDLKTKKRHYLRQAAGVSQVLFSPDGKWVATGSQRGWGKFVPGFRVWEVATGKPWGDEVPTADAPLMTFSADSRTLLAFELREGKLWRWNSDEEKPAIRFDLYREHNARCALFRPDAGQLLVGFPDGAVRRYDTTTGQAIEGTLTHPAAVIALDYSPDGTLLAVGYEDGTAQLWDAATAKPLGLPLVPPEPLLGLAFSADGHSLFTVTDQGSTQTWPVAEPVADDEDRLVVWLQTRIGGRLAEDGMQILNGEAWEASRGRLRQLWPEAAAVLERPAPRAEWHEACAREAEARGEPAVALWHLDRWFAISPPTSSERKRVLQAERAHWRAVLGMREAARKDYEQLERNGSTAALLARYRYHADRLRIAGQWDLTRWYLDRAVALQPKLGELYAERAEAQGRLEHARERRSDLERAIALGEKGKVLLALARERAIQGRWWEARNLLTTAQPTALALVLATLEDRAAYQKLCSEYLAEAKRVGDQISPEGAQLIAHTCATGPQAVSDFAPALALAERACAGIPEAALEEHQQALTTLGALQVRSGQAARALPRLHAIAASARNSQAARAALFLALAYHQLGQDAQARAWLNKAQPARCVPREELDWDGLEIRLLRAEVLETLYPTASSPHAKQVPLP